VRSLVVYVQQKSLEKFDIQLICQLHHFQKERAVRNFRKPKYILRMERLYFSLNDLNFAPFAWLREIRITVEYITLAAVFMKGQSLSKMARFSLCFKKVLLKNKDDEKLTGYNGYRE